MTTDTHSKNKTVPYTHKRGDVSDNVRYLTDATDAGVAWVEGTRGRESVFTLRNYQQSWYYTETKKILGGALESDVLLRASIRRNAYDNQSEIRYEYWTGSSWETKQTLGVEGTPVEHVSYTTPLYRLDTEAFRKTADIVWDIARAYGDL